jgi:hypothetical protein
VVEGVNSSVIYLIHSKNFFKCHNILPLSTMIKEKVKKRSEIYIHRNIIAESTLFSQ